MPLLHGKLPVLFLMSSPPMVAATLAGASDSDVARMEMTAKICRGQIEELSAESLSNLTIDGRSITVNHTNSGFSIKKADGSLIVDVKYDSPDGYVSCMERMAKAFPK